MIGIRGRLLSILAHNSAAMFLNDPQPALKWHLRKERRNLTKDGDYVHAAV